MIAGGVEKVCEEARPLPLPPMQPTPEPPPAAVLSHGRPAQRHVVAPDEKFYHLVFSNKTNCDALCLDVRAKLIERGGVTVWQQTTNTPKSSDNWFNEWYPSASMAIKVACFLTADYLKSPFCMKEFGIAQAKGKLLAVACEPLETITAVDPVAFPHASTVLVHERRHGRGSPSHRKLATPPWSLFAAPCSRSERDCLVLFRTCAPVIPA